ncbi:SUMF1/EgtB/PvdO family nonheme iron enzyme [Ramlibacter rhizophilus]|uniref:Sulfatase-modifying factor enzyme-like domain-containing protein n=1 Tax=Ramlibacter rhizophilus TaxID=1781167 RepID=A0A4Z0BEU2_9BURK|nr:SUMF1/EgtB/PvdO family nonheme iron enzyme [Ramlibacter rhizophilus]TFY96837.1 hypothetical protein EZ242_19370 [Ramlibacter rhizophilus]
MSTHPPAAIDSPAVRHAGRELLSLALMDARNHTLQLLARHEAARGDGAPLPRESWLEPPAWIAGRIAWLAERWIGRNPRRGEGARCTDGGVRLASSLDGADALFEAAPQSPWELALPSMDVLRAWLLETLEATLDVLERTPEDEAGLHFFRAALFHEDACGEQLALLAQQRGISMPLAPPAAVAPREPLWIPATRWRLGHEGHGFRPDLEGPPQDEERVPEFEIDAQPVSWAQFVEFVDEGGYDRPELWQPEGWHWLESAGRRAPGHVEQIGVASGAVLQSWFGRPTRMAGAQPAVHLSWWEADAWARWAGRRLPSELEWELAAQVAATRGFRWGEVHEWTASLLRPWPGQVLEDWTVGTPFDPRPFWGRARARRGASLATRARMKHPKARGFALPERDEAFVGFRTCAQ